MDDSRSNRRLTHDYREVNVGEVAMQVCIVACEGNRLIDAEGRSYIDFCSGSGVTNAGWNRRDVRDAIVTQLGRLPYCAPWYPSEEAIELSRLLLRVSPDHLSFCGRATGGADANELIYRAAYARTGRPSTLTLRRSYHGGTRLTVGLSDAESFRLPQFSSPEKSLHLELPSCSEESCDEKCDEICLNELSRILESRRDIGLLLCEPVLGSGGVIILPPGFLRGAQELCKQHEVVFALDEVITGFGRAGHMCLADAWGLQPDAISYGKGMGGGFVPIAAVVMTEELADAVRSWEDVSQRVRGRPSRAQRRWPTSSSSSERTCAGGLGR